MRAALVLLLLVGGCAQEASGGAVRGAPGEAPLWVLTFNVNFERPSRRTVRAIAASRADVVFLQETHQGWEHAVRDALGAEYAYMEFFDAPAEGGLAILSRHPLVGRVRDPAPAGVFPAWRGVVRAPIGDLDVLHVHLRPPLDEEGRLWVGYFTTGAARLAELRHHVGGSVPDVVLGDFNEGEGVAIDSLLGSRLVEAQRAFPPVERTWRWDVSGGEITGRPDHVFVGARFRVAAVQVMERGGSDHRPLRVALEAAR